MTEHPFTNNPSEVGSKMCRYFELCDDSSVGIWKLLFRQSGCLGPDMSEEGESDGNETEMRNYFTLSDDGLCFFHLSQS